MTKAIHQNTTLRVGVFSTPHQADKVIESLLAAGFTTEQITVICSDATRQRHFHEFEHQARGASVAPRAVAAGGAIGAVVGGLAAVTAAMATGGMALLFTGGAAAWAGAVVGGLVGAMMTRGVSRELADFYEASVSQGKILVAAEDHAPGAEPHLGQAERIFAENGALPLAIEES